MNHMIQTAAYYLVFTVVGMTTASFGPGLPGFAAGTGSTLAQVGALFVFHRIGYITGSLGWGRLVDRLKGNSVTGIVLLVIAMGLFSISASGTLPVLLGSVLMIGIAQGTAEVGANTGIVRLHGASAGPYMNGLHLSFGVGAMLSPLVLAAALKVFGIQRPGFWFLAVVAAAAGVWVLRLPDPGIADREETGGYSEGSVLLVLFFAALMFFTIAGEAGFAGWIYSYALRTGLAGEGRAGFLNSAFWGALTVGRFAGIDLIRRLGVRKLLLVNCGGAVAASAVFLLFPGTAAALWFSVILLGFSQASIIPAAFTLAGERHVLSGAVAGIFVAASSAGGMSFPWLIGRYFDSVGPAILPRLVLVSQAAAFAALLGVLRNSRSNRGKNG